MPKIRGGPTDIIKLRRPTWSLRCQSTEATFLNVNVRIEPRPTRRLSASLLGDRPLFDQTKVYAIGIADDSISGSLTEGSTVGSVAWFL